MIDHIFVEDREFFYTHLHSTPPLILIVLSRLDRGTQSATEMLPLERGRGVAHSFNCMPAFVNMRLANALVFIFVTRHGRVLSLQCYFPLPGYRYGTSATVTPIGVKYLHDDTYRSRIQSLSFWGRYPPEIPNPVFPLHLTDR